MENKKQLPLRIGVGIVLLNDKNNVFVGKRIDNPKNSWQMPQGGVNQKENFFHAAKRELEEETGIKSVKLIKELDGWFKYDLPKNLLGKIGGGDLGPGEEGAWDPREKIAQNTPAKTTVVNFGVSGFHLIVTV